MSVTHPGPGTDEPGKHVSAPLINFNDISEIEEGFATAESASNLCPALGQQGRGLSNELSLKSQLNGIRLFEN
jgi:hypothetical protein